MENAKAALSKALDDLDGVPGNGLNLDDLRCRVADEIGRGKARASKDPVKAVLIALAAGCIITLAVVAVVRPFC